jgi:hypothetical protein
LPLLLMATKTENFLWASHPITTGMAVSYEGAVALS